MIFTSYKTKTAMKTQILATALSLFLGISSAFANKYKVEGDSLIIQFGNNTRMVIHAKDKASIKNLKNYDLNKIVKDMGLSLDSTDKETYIIIAGQNAKKYLRDTVVSVKREKDGISINIKNPDDKKEDNNLKVSIKEGGISFKEGKEKVYVGSKGIYVEDGDEKIQIGNNNPFEDSVSRVKRPISRSPRNGFSINLGLNTYSKNMAGSFNTESYDLNTWGSRYLSLGWTRGGLVSRGQNASSFLDLGINFSWYNMMYQGNNTVKKGITMVAFPDFMIDGKATNLSKSKLTATFLNVSLMPTVAFKNGALKYLSFGPYAGYRIDSYTKTKEASNRNKERLRDNFYLNNFRYGLAVELGVRNFPDFFVQYDLNELFKDAKGPKAQMISFGIKL